MLPTWRIIILIGASIAIAVMTSVWLVEYHTIHGHRDYITHEQWYRQDDEQRAFREEIKRELRSINQKLMVRPPY